MTTYILINSLILFCIISMIGYLLYKQINANRSISNQQSSDDINNLTILDLRTKILLILAFLLLIFSFFAPFIFTRPSINRNFDFSTKGQIGDTIGGLMNPFIALSGVIVTGLAFYIQYKANLLQRKLFQREQEENKRQLQEQINNQNKQIRLQQFESQFYEMLKLHRENITEMRINGYDYEEGENQLTKKINKAIEGRKVFVAMKTELECILAIFTKWKKLDRELFKECYTLFFSGVNNS